MKTVDVATTLTVVLAHSSGAAPFIALKNPAAGTETLYLAFDGEDATVADGWPLEPGAQIILNPGMMGGNRKINAIHDGAGTHELKVQGLT